MSSSKLEGANARRSAIQKIRLAVGTVLLAATQIIQAAITPPTELSVTAPPGSTWGMSGGTVTKDFTGCALGMNDFGSGNYWSLELANITSSGYWGSNKFDWGEIPSVGPFGMMGAPLLLNSCINPSEWVVAGAISSNATPGAKYTFQIRNKTGYQRSFQGFTTRMNEISSFTLTVIVGESNSAPIAKDQTLNIEEDSSGLVTLSATDADNDPLTYHLVKSPPKSHGVIEVVNNEATFTPAKHWNGTTSFSYKAQDSAGNYSNVAVVTINVLASRSDTPGYIDPTHFEVTFEDGSKYKDIYPGEEFMVVATYREPDTSKGIRLFGDGFYSQSSYLTILSERSLFEIPSSEIIKSPTDMPHDCRINSNAPCANNSTESTYTIKAKVSETMISPSYTAMELVDGVYQWVTTPAYELPYGPRKITVSPMWGPACNQTQNIGNLMTKCSRPINIAGELTLNVIGTSSNKPLINDKVISIDEDTIAKINLASENPQIEESDYKWVIVAAPDKAFGKAEVLGDELTFTPEKDWNGVATMKYQATDSRGKTSNEATITVTVHAVNDTPVAINELIISTIESRGKTVEVKVTTSP